MDTQSLTFAYDMATLALKGKRFREAEEKFRELAMQTNSVEAWCGMAISKYGLIMEDVSISEVFYCFEKARKLATEENLSDLVSIIQISSLECASLLYDVYVKAVLLTRSANQRKNIAMISTIVGGISTMNAASNNKTLSTIASAGFTAISYDSFLKSHSSAEELKQVQQHVVKLIEEIKESVKIALGETHEKWVEFEVFTETRQQAVIEALKTDDQRAYEKTIAEKSRNEKQPPNYTVHSEAPQVTEVQKEKLKYLEEKKKELNDINHPFHLSKGEAQKLFENRKYKEALRYANLASTYFNEDEEIKKIQDTVAKRRMRLTLLAIVPLWMISSIIVGMSLKIQKAEWAFTLTGIPVVIYFLWKSHQIKTDSATLVELQTKQVTKL